MKKLTKHQANFIVNNFFIDSRYPGSRSIGEKLVENGKCIVAGTKSIYVGGIGNFIKTKEADDCVDCLEYTFDINMFLSSKWYKETQDLFLNDLGSEIKRLKQEVIDFEQQYKEISQL